MYLLISTDKLKRLHSKSELRPGALVDLDRVVFHTPEVVARVGNSFEAELG